MSKPIEVYENPGAYWHLITTAMDVDFEDQHFDRKEAGRPDPAGHLPSGKLAEIITQAKETISAFANANRDGGLLVIGVSTTGDVKGLSHLNDSQRNTRECMPASVGAQVCELLIGLSSSDNSAAAGAQIPRNYERWRSWVFLWVQTWVHPEG